MDTTAEVLLIIVSSALSVFLVLLIVALSYGICIMRRAKDVIDRAENVADSVEAAASAFKKTATPIAVIKFISKIVAHSQKRKKG
jgi:predicted RND superfamily exporter protein